MTLSPASRPILPGRQQRHTCGGNWPASTHAWPFSFKALEQPTQFVAQMRTADPSLREGSRAGAAQKGIVRFAVNCAKSLPPVFLKADYIFHWGGSLFVDETKFNRSAVA